MREVIREEGLKNVEERAVLELKPDEFAKLPVSKASKFHYDVLLTPQERRRYGLLWLFECDHALYVLVGVGTPDGGGVLKLPDGHEDCDYVLYPKSALEIVENDPFQHFLGGRVVWYDSRFWYDENKGNIYLRVSYPTYTVHMNISVHEKKAIVTFTFKNVERFSVTFEADFEEAVTVFRELYQQKRIRPLPGATRAASDPFVRYIEPGEAIERLKKK